MGERVVKRILVPVDLSGAQAPETAYAIGLAAQLDAELILLAVIDSPTMVRLIGHHRAAAARGTRQADFQAGLVEDAKHILQAIVDSAAERGVEAWGHAVVSEDVEEQILKEAFVQRVDLIVVRSQGHGGFMKALLGSTAGDILKAAPCPVLVARV